MSPRTKTDQRSRPPRNPGHTSPAAGRPRTGMDPALAVLLTMGPLVVLVYSGFFLSAGADVLSFGSGLFDADVLRVAGIAALLPLVYLNLRRQKLLTWSETLVWTLVGVFCFGITITQGVHFVLAFGFRLFAVYRSGRASSRPVRSWIARPVLTLALVP